MSETERAMRELYDAASRHEFRASASFHRVGLAVECDTLDPRRVRFSAAIAFSDGRSFEATGDSDLDALRTLRLRVLADADRRETVARNDAAPFAALAF